MPAAMWRRSRRSPNYDSVRHSKHPRAATVPVGDPPHVPHRDRAPGSLTVVELALMCGRTVEQIEAELDAVNDPYNPRTAG
jgi:hypothetical protein